MTMRRALLLIPLFLVFVFALILRWQWQNAQPAAQRRAFAPQLRWRAASGAERSAAVAAISAQLEAFRADDYDVAMKYQSKGMQRQFGSPENFRSMMKRGYPQFAAPKSYTFGPARATQDATLIAVPLLLKGADGVTVRAEYLMQKESGGYRVISVQGGMSMRRRMRPPSKNQFNPDMSV